MVMSDIEWIKEIRRWVQSDKAEKSAINLSNAFRDLRQNLEPLNKELKELGSNTKKSKQLLSQLTTIQENVEKQTNTLILLTIVMTIFTVLQFYLTFLR